MPRDAEREYRPDIAAPAAGRPTTATPTAELPLAVQPPGQPAHSQPTSGQPIGWFEPGWGRPPQPGPAQPGSSPYPLAEPDASPYGSAPFGNAAPGSAGYSGAQYSSPQYSPGQQPGTQYPGTQYPGSQYPDSQYPGSQFTPPSQPAGGVAVLTPAPPPDPAPAAIAFPRPDLTMEETAAQASGAWPDICDQFGLHLLVLAEQLRASLDELESDEGDPERLRRLYQVDHAVTRMRRASRDLRTLAGQREEELAGFTTSLLDVIRMANSAIERYTQVTVGRVTDLAVLGYAADDVGSLMASLLDNATRYSPGTVTVSGHLLDDGGVMFRIEDTGIGIGADQVAAINAALAGPVLDVDDRTGRHTGFPVVHRIARKHQIGVRLASRPLPSSGTVAMVTLPPHLLCEVPAEEAQRRPAPATGTPAKSSQRANPVTDLPARGEPTRPQRQPPQAAQWEPPDLPEREQPRLPGELPRRERASLRGDDPRPKLADQAQSPEQQAAARRAFAQELSAFSLGATGSVGMENADFEAFEEEDQP